AMVDAGHHHGGAEEVEGIIPQMRATPGMPVRQAVERRRARVREIMHTLPPAAQAAIRESLNENDDTQVLPAYTGDSGGNTFQTTAPQNLTNG
ncbi:ABC transporter ATP-binding protein, partial [Nocardia farcinica]|nr:ABC transporter ATP-binding protein [Nocardia farcinica]MBF6382392.1 ABC transporter ATP-binding protein [Nocardia farcinica]MBF6445986.1 ABC transporter ATP-binding protein [Nocardia farcinica]